MSTGWPQQPALVYGGQQPPFGYGMQQPDAGFGWHQQAGFGYGQQARYGPPPNAFFGGQQQQPMLSYDAQHGPQHAQGPGAPGSERGGSFQGPGAGHRRSESF